MKERPAEKGTAKFYVYWRDEGGKQRAKVFRNRSQAEEFLLERDGEAPDPSAVPFSKFWGRYLSERAKKRLTPKVLSTSHNGRTTTEHGRAAGARRSARAPG